MIRRRGYMIRGIGDPFGGAAGIRTLVHDKFTGTTGDDLNGRTPDTVNPGDTWSIRFQSGKRIQITANEAEYISNNAYYTINSGEGKNFTIYCDMYFDASIASGAGIHLRVVAPTGVGNTYRIAVNEAGNTVTIYDYTTSLASGAVSITPNVPITFKIVVKIASITVFADDVEICSTAVASNNQAEGRHGIYAFHNEAIAHAFWDNFIVTTP